MKIIIDQRERNIELLEGLAGYGMDIVIETLHIGDYIISDRVAVERKTVSDFESSIVSGRLFDQLERLKQHYSSPIIIIEGDPALFRFANNVITGAIASIYIDHGVQVIQSSDVKHTAAILRDIAKHEQHEQGREPSLKGGARALSDSQFQQYIIGNLPGVGPKLAKALLGRFGSVRAVANAEIKELMEVDKIGKKKAQRIHQTLNAIYDADGAS